MDVGPLRRSVPQQDEAFRRLLSIVLSPGSPIYDTSVPKRQAARKKPTSSEASLEMKSFRKFCREFFTRLIMNLKGSKLIVMRGIY